VPRARDYNLGTLFGRLAPLNLGGQKTVQNFSRFLTTFHFDREYLRNLPINRKSKKLLINYDPSYVGLKMFLNFGPQTKKLLTWVLTHRSAHFSVDCIFALNGGCALKFLHSLEIDKGYLAHTLIGKGVPPPKKKFNRESVKFGLKFSVYTSISSQLMGISSQIFIQTTCCEPGVITWVQFLEGLPPKIWDGQKTVQNFSQFLTTFDFDRQYLRSGSTNRKSKKTVDQLRPLPRRAKKSFWTLVHKRKSYWREYWPTVVRIFRETVFSPLGGGGCALKFLHALEIDQGYLAHTPIGTGVPQKN